MSVILTESPDELGDRLDQLIPPPMSEGRKLLAGTSLVVLAAGFTFLNFGGYLWPRPTAGTSYSSGRLLEADGERGVTVARVMLPNNSGRAIRITDVALDAPGAELVEVRVLIEPPLDRRGGTPAREDRGYSAGEAGGVDTSAATPVDESELDTAAALPVTVQPGETAFLALWFDPLDCSNAPEADRWEGEGRTWGVADVRLDFGDGAFPPLSRWLRLDQDPIGENGVESSILIGDELVTGAHPLDVACEVAR